MIWREHVYTKPLRCFLVFRCFHFKVRCQEWVPKPILCQRECDCITFQHGDPLSCYVGLLSGACLMKNCLIDRGECVLTGRQGEGGFVGWGGDVSGPGSHVCWKGLIGNYREEASLQLEGVVLRTWSLGLLSTVQTTCLWNIFCQLHTSQSVSCSLFRLLITSPGLPSSSSYSTQSFYYCSVITLLIVYLGHPVLDNTITFLMVEFFSADSE